MCVITGTYFCPGNAADCYLEGVWNISLSIMALNLSEVRSEILERPWLRESDASLGGRELRLPMLVEEVILFAAPEVVGIIKFETLRGDFGIEEESRLRI